MSDEIVDTAAPDHLRARIDEIMEKFKQTYGSLPDLFSCVPGRVNLIGNFVLVLSAASLL